MTLCWVSPSLVGSLLVIICRHLQYPSPLSHRYPTCALRLRNARRMYHCKPWGGFATPALTYRRRTLCTNPNMYSQLHHSYPALARGGEAELMELEQAVRRQTGQKWPKTANPGFCQKNDRIRRSDFSMRIAFFLAFQQFPQQPLNSVISQDVIYQTQSTLPMSQRKHIICNTRIFLCMYICRASLHKYYVI